MSVPTWERALGRQRQGCLEFEAQPGLHNSRLCLKNKPTTVLIIVFFPLTAGNNLHLAENMYLKKIGLHFDSERHVNTLGFTTKIFVIITTDESMASIN